mmetsp:Transcript_26830/g.86145  ORF Transcript_26830/g.86145 Transcript_26830/m.86145 type:complete len:401 (-) Transcript_26830:30-1232(-)
MSPRVTDCTPPTRSLRVGFLMMFSRIWPWAVPMSCTPRSAIVRHASASASVPISSTITISGMWFSTASIMIRCCSLGTGTCMRRAPPMAGCGTSPSPPISLEVSTITTRLWSSSESTRAISRITVVLPTPGRPRKSSDSGAWRVSRIISMWPMTARPTRQVRPTTLPLRLRMALIRCRVPVMPARLSMPNSPTSVSAHSRSASVISASRRYSPAPTPRKRASGFLPRSMTISRSSPRLGWDTSVPRMSSGKHLRRESRSSRTWTDPSSSSMHLLVGPQRLLFSSSVLADVLTPRRLYGGAGKQDTMLQLARERPFKLLKETPAWELPPGAAGAMHTTRDVELERPRVVALLPRMGAHARPMAEWRALISAVLWAPRQGSGGRVDPRGSCGAREAVAGCWE